MHTDFAHSEGATAIVASARQRGVPVVSARQLLTWVDGRNASIYRDLAWDGSVLTFSLGRRRRARPRDHGAADRDGSQSRASRRRAAVAFREETIKGIAYAMFRASSAPYRVSYAPPPDRLSGVVTVVSSGRRSHFTVSAFDTLGFLVVSSSATRPAPIAPWPGGPYLLRALVVLAGFAVQVLSGVICFLCLRVVQRLAGAGDRHLMIAPVNFALLRDLAVIIYLSAIAIVVVTSRRFEWIRAGRGRLYPAHRLGAGYVVRARRRPADRYTFLVTTTPGSITAS